METGTVDVRTRDTERHGKMRVDEVHEYFQKLLPGKSQKYESFYKKAWDPENFKVEACCNNLQEIKVNENANES